jgi:hypothetical protein
LNGESGALDLLMLGLHSLRECSQIAGFLWFSSFEVPVLVGEKNRIEAG